MSAELMRLYFSLLKPFIFICFMWIIKAYEMLSHNPLGFLGILPRSIKGMIGIITAPLIHGDLAHLVSNTWPVLILGSSIYFFYDKIADRLIILLYLMTNILVFLFARPVYHIGASGLVFAMAFFLVFSGLLRKDRVSLAVALFVIFLYGGMVWSIFPLKEGISWESHLSGAITGILLAYIFYKKEPPKPEEDLDNDPDNETQSPEYRMYKYL